jgi:hypothetical protein
VPFVFLNIIRSTCLCRNLREMFKIDAADYMISICGSDALRELSSPGKSGSVFFLSQDDRFMIKTLRKSEVQVSYHFNDFRSNAFHKIFLSQNILPYPIKNFSKV